MAMDYTNSYAQIVKYDVNDDGTLMVFGKATDDTLDLDSQICDPTWLDTAMPAWFKSGGNIREMHGPSAAGVAKEYESKADGHYIGVHVVDPIAVKKVEARVYQGFSIGIKSPRVVRDSKAANGRIIDGQIIEVSLVDRPANPSAKLILAKSIEGESTLVQVEELHEYKAPLPSEIAKHGDHDQSDHAPSGGGGSSSSSERDSADNPRDPSINENRDNSFALDTVSDVQDQLYALDALNDEDSDSFIGTELSDEDQNLMDSATQDLNAASQSLDSASNSTMTDAGHYDRIETARGHLEDAFDSLRNADSKEIQSIADRIDDIASSLDTYLEEFIGDSRDPSIDENKSARTKTSKGSKMKKIERIAALAKSLTPDAAKFDQTMFDNARRALAELIAMEAAEMGEGHDERNSLSALVGAVHALMAWYEGEEAEGEVPMEHETIELAADGDTEREEAVGEKMCDKCNKAVEDCICEDKAVKESDMEEDAKKSADHKCLECGCGLPAEDHGRADVTTADMVTEKSVDTPADENEATEISEDETSDDKTIEALVEKAVKSAMESVKVEIDTLRAEKESAVEKSVKLETELTTALSKTVAGGPKRTATNYGAESNEYLVKALTYKAKADATTDPVLQKGYRDLYEEFSAKAFPAQNK